MSGHWWYVSWETNWAAGLEHPPMSSPHGLGFPTTWWLDSKGEPGRGCLQIFMTKPQSYILSLMQDPHSFHKPLPRGKRKEQTWAPSHCGGGSHPRAWGAKHTGVAFFGKYNLPDTVCPNWVCSYTRTRSTSFVFYISEQNQYQFSHPNQSVGIIFDSSLIPLPVNHGLGQFWPVTALRFIHFLSFLLVPKFKLPPPPTCQGFPKWSPLRWSQIVLLDYTRLDCTILDCTILVC